MLAYLLITKKIMKNGLNIFCNNNIKNFLPSLLSDYELTVMNLDVIKDNLQTSQANIIILSNNDIDVSVFEKFISNPINERVFAYNTISDLELTKEISANSNNKIYFGVSLDDFASNVPLKIPFVNPEFQTLFSNSLTALISTGTTSDKLTPKYPSPSSNDIL